MRLLGIDLGTQSCKVVVCDRDLGVVAEASAPISTRHPAPGAAEQAPADWLAALAAAARAALPPGAVVDAVGITGQLDGAIAVDRQGAALGNALIWMDRRAPLPPLPPDFFARTGQVADPSHLGPKAAWLAAQREVARVHVPVSFLVEQLTGVSVLDTSHASTTMLAALAHGGWDAELLACFGLTAGQLPAIAPAHDRAGALTAAGAALLGVPAGTPVAVGTGDDFATPLGAGLVAPGEAFAVLGTAEVVGALAAAPRIDPTGLVETHPYPAGGFVLENPGWLSGGALRWLGDLVGLDDAGLDAAAARAAPGAGGLSFVPALTGAMSPAWHAGARGAFYGLTPGHGAAELARAVHEALAFAAHDVLGAIAAQGVAMPQVTLLGGGARSALAPGLRAAVSQRPHAVPARVDTAAIGAAMLGGVAVGAWASLAHAAAIARPAARVTEPTPAPALAQAYARYRRLVAALTPLYADAAG